MNIQQLKYFVVLCEKKSFTKAAESLFITQQGLNMAISNLESEFSCKFFDRTPKGLNITPDGEFFRQHAEVILNEVGEMWSHFEGRDNSHTIIHVASCHGVLSDFGAELVRQFEEKYQGSQVYVREFQDRMVDTAVAEDRAEIGFGLEPMDTEKFECHRVYEVPLVLIVHENDPIARYERVPTAMLENRPLIVVDETFKSADLFIDECKKQGVKVTPKFRVGDITTVHRLVRQGLGIGLTTYSVAESLHTETTVYKYFESDKFSWAIDIFKKKNAVLPHDTRIFFEFTQRKMSKDDMMKYAPDKILEQHLT